jgi:hypothetical protein
MTTFSAYSTLRELSSTTVLYLSTELNFARREVKEAIEIKTKRPSLNRDGGYELPPVYDHLLSQFNST